MGYALLQYKGKQNVKNLPLQFVHHNPDYEEQRYSWTAGTLSAIPYSGSTGQSGSNSITTNLGRKLTQPYYGRAPGSFDLAAYAGVGALGSFLDTLLDSLQILEVIF